MLDQQDYDLRFMTNNKYLIHNQVCANELQVLRCSDVNPTYVNSEYWKYITE